MSTLLRGHIGADASLGPGNTLRYENGRISLAPALPDIPIICTCASHCLMSALFFFETRNSELRERILVSVVLPRVHDIVHVGFLE